MANKREMQYIIDGYVNSRFYKSIKSANNSLARVSNSMRGLNSMQAQSAAVSKKAARGNSIFAGGLMKTVIGTAAAFIGIQQMVSGYSAVSTEAMDAIKVQTRLSTLMMNVKGTTSGQVAAIGEYASKLQNLTTIEDDTTKAGASQLATYQLQFSNIKSLLPALQDLAVGTYGVNVNQEQMIQSGNLLGKVFTGQVGALRRVGVTFSKTQEKILKTGNQSQKTAMLIKVISQNYGGLARKMAKTPEGRIIQLRNAWAGVKQEIGMKLMPIQEKLVKYLTDHLPEIQAFINRVIKAVEKWSVRMKPVWETTKKVGNFIITNWPKIEPMILSVAAAYTTWKVATIAVTAAQWALNVAMDANPVGLIVLAIGAVVGALTLWITQWDHIKAGMQDIERWKILFKTFLPVAGVVITVIDLIAKKWNKVTDAAKSAYNWIMKYIKLASNIPTVKVAGMAVKAAGKMLAGKREDGGPVSAGRSYLVGERGPERFTPSRSGSIIPNLAMAGSGGINVNLVVNVPGGSAADVESGIRNGVDYLKNQLRQIRRDEVRRSFDG
ncbi:MAG: hypothetical protein ACYC27_03135 [Armatimonadota bacterium]